MSLNTFEDRQRFAEFYHATYDELLELAFGMLHNKHDAEETVHDVYAKLADDYNSYKTKSVRKMKSIAVTATRNSSINLIRKRERHREILIDIKENMLGSYDNVQMDFLRKCKEQDIKNALDKLKTDDRDILILKYYLEMSYSEMGKLLSLKNKTVEVRLRRAKQRLEEILREESYYSRSPRS